MTDKQILDQLHAGALIFMIVSFVISFCLCVMLLPTRGREKVYISVVLSIIIPQLSCIFPLYFYIFVLSDPYHSFAGKVFRSVMAITFFVSPHWIVLLILLFVIFARHFRSEGKSYLADALAALVIGGTLAALATYAAIVGAPVEPVDIG